MPVLLDLLIFLIGSGLKIEDGEIVEDTPETPKEMKDSVYEESSGKTIATQGESKPGTWSRRDGNQRTFKMVTILVFPTSCLYECLSDQNSEHISAYVVIRALIFLLQSMFQECCQKMKILNWLVEIRECWANFWGH